MNKTLSKALLVVILLFVATVHAADSKSVNIAFTLSMPPYLSDDLSSGVEHAVIEAALKAGGLSMGSVRNVHYLRAIELMKVGSVDAIVSNLNNYRYEKMSPKPNASAPTLNYVDCAITLSEREISLASISDYKGKLIWAFKSARSTLGPEFEKMAESNPYYTEDFNQEKQVEMIASKRIDVAISDRNIFNAKMKQLNQFKADEFSYHELAPPTPRTVRFRDENLLQLFNQGLETIKKNGVYQKIFTDHKGSYSADCNRP